MELGTIDWIIIGSFFVISLIIGMSVSKSSSKSAADFFLSGRNMPWWLLGVSMVATTFSADTPNLVADIVRKGGVAGNWAWWAFLLTGMMTVFIFARLWRKSELLTDLEFYELRYSGKPAAFLRGFRAIYLGFFFNVVIMASVCVAMIKIAGILLGFSPVETLIIASVVTVVYSVFGGLKGVLITDFFQFMMAMIGSVWATIYILDMPEIGGVSGIMEDQFIQDSGKLNMLPDFNSPDIWIPLFLIPIAIQWWSAWYPGAEPGGGGYIAQRMLSAKNEKHATGATLFFNLAHYALRPWPWILIALASILYFPMQMDKVNHLNISVDAVHFLNQNTEDKDVLYLKSVSEYQFNEDQKNADLKRIRNYISSNINSYQVKSLAYLLKSKSSDESKDDIAKAPKLIELESLVALQLENPTLPVDKLDHDASYPSMINQLPSGLKGLILASLIAAFMSTISTHLNWGSSYIVNDVYKRFINVSSTEKQLVNIGRISIVILMLFSGLLALTLESALDSFQLIIKIGAGTGLLFILRWFWPRISAYSEIAAMVFSLIFALIFHFMDFGFIPPEYEIIYSTLLTTLSWIIVTLITPGTDKIVLDKFNAKIFGQ
ncbi:MAG: Na+:solute symporter, partial [Crocinitomicaceae bacterium]|nr:Na+:solute symporter [Crocinitomicaceae bacterium]